MKIREKMVCNKTTFCHVQQKKRNGGFFNIFPSIDFFTPVVDRTFYHTKASQNVVSENLLKQPLTWKYLNNLFDLSI